MELNKVIAYKKMMNLINKYLNSTKTEEMTESFCNQYMDLFYNLSDNLENEVDRVIFETFDDINLICDSYERNPEIRYEDKYCIDEQELIRKVKLLVNKIDML